MSAGIWRGPLRSRPAKQIGDFLLILVPRKVKLAVGLHSGQRRAPLFVLGVDIRTGLDQELDTLRSLPINSTVAGTGEEGKPVEKYRPRFHGASRLLKARRWVGPKQLERKELAALNRMSVEALRVVGYVEVFDDP